VERAEPVLRTAGPGDAGEIRALMEASVAGLFPDRYGPEQVASALLHLAVPDPALLADGTYFVLASGDEHVACGGWSRRGRLYPGSGDAEGDGRLLDPASDAGHIRAMFVRPDWTRRGLGRRILDECERAARWEGFTRLDLMATLPGVPLYRACGFEAIEEHGVLLADGTPLPCIAMAKSLGQDGAPESSPGPSLH
jgi:GNAT superfamily N-acetyltransferase